MRNKILENKYMLRGIWVFILLILWEITSQSGVFSPLIFPSLFVIFKALYTSIVNGEIISQTGYSLMLIFEGLVIGLFIAIMLSSISMVYKVFGSLVETLTAIANPLPGVALLPLIILWVGTGSTSIVFVIIHSVLWPMILNMMTGFKSMPKIYKELGQNFGLTTFGIIRNIMIPASLPYLLTGFKIGWARAWRALISAEMIFGAAGGKGGLGWYIFKNRVFMDTPGMFAGLIVIIVIGILVEDFIFSIIENITVKKWGMTV